MKANAIKTHSTILCLLTYPYSLHLRSEWTEQLKQDQTQRVDVYFVRVRVSRKLQEHNYRYVNIIQSRVVYTVSLCRALSVLNNALRQKCAML